jgi:hypothetical protein
LNPVHYFSQACNLIRANFTCWSHQDWELKGHKQNIFNVSCAYYCCVSFHSKVPTNTNHWHVASGFWLLQAILKTALTSTHPPNHPSRNMNKRSTSTDYALHFVPLSSIFSQDRFIKKSFCLL